MRRPATALFLVASIILSATTVRPYTLQFTDASTPVQIKWAAGTINIALSPSLASPPANIKAGSNVLRAARRALARWSEAANIQFVEVSSSAQSISAAGGNGDGISLITIAHTPENSALFTGASSVVPGRTRVFFTQTGVITEADIVLNPGQQFSADGTPGTYDLEATLMHEIGHLLGLEHSSVVGATMQPRQGKNGIYGLSAWTSRTLSDDDRAGVRAMYGVRAGLRAWGAIAGVINFAGGLPAPGANVWAEEAATGRTSASSITLANGAYRIEGLLPGKYRVVVEALNGPVMASEIASARGAYAGLATQSPAFRTLEIGEARVVAGITTALNAQLSSEPKLLNPSLIGINEQLSTVAVPLAAGKTQTVYLSGEGLNANQMQNISVSATSPFIKVNAKSIRPQQYSDNIFAISFDLTVKAGAPAGDYSLRLQTSNGEVAYIAGGLAIDDAWHTAGPAPQSQTPAAPPALGEGQ